MNYIADTLGIEVTTEQWVGAARLPFYLSDGYTFQMVRIGDTECLFVKPKGELVALPAVKKHLAKIAEHTNVPLVLELDALRARQRKALIAAHTPFIVSGNQLYLPFIGVVLQERYINRSEAKDTLSPTAQLMLFRYLYQGEGEMYANGLAELFGVSAMQITRAVKQLIALGLVTTRKDGVQIVITGTESGSALFDKARPYLLNPIRKKFFIEKDVLPPNLPPAGLSALAVYTMINYPSTATYAFDGRVGELQGTDMLVDTDAQAEIEIWKYSAELLSTKEGLPDPLSLWVTLADGDARIEIAKDKLLADIWSNG